MDGEFSRYLDDPAQTGITRAPLTDEVDVAIIGTGIQRVAGRGPAAAVRRGEHPHDRDRG